MARLSDQELQDLKARALNAAVNGTLIARAEEYLVDLITEVLESRSKATPSTKATLQVGEMTVAKTEPAPAPAPEEKVEALREALSEGEKSPVSTDYSLEKVLAQVVAEDEKAEAPTPAPAPIKDEPTKPTKRSKK